MNEIICGDALTVLRAMPDESIQCCVTSPPYFGLRDYGCAGQIGLEETPERYIERLTEIFREVRRVLKPDGTAWINIGDSYAGWSHGKNPRAARPCNQGSGKGAWNKDPAKIKNKQGYKYTMDNPASQMPKTWDGIKPKDMLGIPWALAFSLRNDGWYLRSSIIWAKPNAMPQSVKDRPTSSYEHIFLLSKSRNYYYDHEAVKEPVAASTVERMKRGRSENHKYANGAPGQPMQAINLPRKKLSGADAELPEKRALRDVWQVCTNAFRTAHFATYPVGLIRPCILAGCPVGGIVLDPFVGSGTTCIAALSEGRNYIGIELNPEYCAIAEERIIKYTTT